MLKKKNIVFLIILLLMLFVNTNKSSACIGKTIIIGYKNSNEQKLLAELLYIIITERTGTTVVLKPVLSTDECYKALEKNEISLYVEYIGVAYNNNIIGGNSTNLAADAVFEAVKNNYSEKKNLVWLSLFSFESMSPENAFLREKGLPLNAGPVIGKETLKMFPILPRLINKLTGKLDNSSMKALMKLIENDKINPKIAAQNFLKNNKLI